MAMIESWFDCDLEKAVNVKSLNGLVFSEDNKGNLIGVNVLRNGQPQSISGSVTGICILADGASVSVAGTISGNKAYIVLPETAYTVPGRIIIIIKLLDGGSTTTLAAINSTVFGTGGTAPDPSSQTIASWTAMIQATLTAIQGNSVRYDTTQSLTTEQKNRAKTNIGAHVTATQISGDNYKIVFP